MTEPLRATCGAIRMTHDCYFCCGIRQHLVGRCLGCGMPTNQCLRTWDLPKRRTCRRCTGGRCSVKLVRYWFCDLCGDVSDGVGSVEENVDLQSRVSL